MSAAVLNVLLDAAAVDLVDLDVVAVDFLVVMLELTRHVVVGVTVGASHLTLLAGLCGNRVVAVPLATWEAAGVRRGRVGARALGRIGERRD